MAARRKLTPWMYGVRAVTFPAGLLFGSFFLFSFLCVVTYVFIWRYVPETKGHSLEEIQERWVVKGDRMLEEEPAA